MKESDLCYRPNYLILFDEIESLVILILFGLIAPLATPSILKIPQTLSGFEGVGFRGSGVQDVPVGLEAVLQGN